MSSHDTTLRLTIPQYLPVKDSTLTVNSLIGHKVAALGTGLRLHPCIFTLLITNDLTIRILLYLMLKLLIVPGFISVIDILDILPLYVRALPTNTLKACRQGVV
jgi:hypothetical protein